jgi:3-dehydroquinate dehydratase-2
MIHVDVIHGPNLNLLGLREPEVYGALSLEQIDERIRSAAKGAGVDVRIFQSNSEGEIIDRIHSALDWADAIVINPGAYTHTSVAIRDAIAAVRLPTIEVHLSNVHRREEFRRHSYISGVTVGQIVGFGVHSYLLAIAAARELVQEMRR